MPLVIILQTSAISQIFVQICSRQQIYVIQLQGHIFFGNVTNLTDDIRDLIKNKKTAGYEPSVVILDFAHVLGVGELTEQLYIVYNFYPISHTPLFFARRFVSSTVYC